MKFNEKKIDLHIEKAVKILEEANKDLNAEEFESYYDSVRDYLLEICNEKNI